MHHKMSRWRVKFHEQMWTLQPKDHHALWIRLIWSWYKYQTDRKSRSGVSYYVLFYIIFLSCGSETKIHVAAVVLSLSSFSNVRSTRLLPECAALCGHRQIGLSWSVSYQSVSLWVTLASSGYAANASILVGWWLRRGKVLSGNNDGVPLLSNWTHRL